MKKKISLLIGLVLMTLCFTGCAKTEETVEYEEANIQQVADFLIQYCDSADDVTIEEWKSLPEFTQEYQIMSVGLPITPESFIGAMESWKAGVEECGAYVSHGDYTYEAKADSLVVSSKAQFAERDAEIVFTFDDKLQLESTTVNAKFTLSEILKKAGMNTLLGMGTVFAVLILISFIISLFKYISKLEQGSKKAAKEEKAAPVAASAAAPAAQKDDLELIAVISAAIAAAEGTSTDGFVVRSIRRRPSNKWKA